ncbi:GAF domain-containing protein [Paractinoplanes maris]|uniref:GAF domain-containing protein n=1 Tax=Paractinoplanes maris TaxID=1734446 RepID=UPI00202014AD|nr:GAF domain-containing protein [Actinoplanes maris]
MATLSLPELFARLGSPQRIRRIASYDLFDPGLRPLLDAIAARNAERLHAPVSMVSVILDSSQFILGSHGVTGWVAEAQGTPAEWSLCTHTVLGGRPYCVSDNTQDPLHADNPLLAMSGLRSYAGVPLRDDSGQSLGSLCVVDVVPRDFTDEDLEFLQQGADDVMRVLADHRTG